MIKKLLKRSSKTTSVKVNNKAQNKASKTKQNKTANKRKQQDRRSNNLCVARDKFQDDVTDEENKNDYTDEDDYEGGSKRKRLADANESEVFEASYKVKAYLKEREKARNQKIFALPVKNESGQIVRNTRKPMEDVQEPKIAKKEAAIVLEKEKEVEKPKTAIEMIREKKECLDKNKQKIALFSRDILQNPQEEVRKIKLKSITDTIFVQYFKIYKQIKLNV